MDHGSEDMEQQLPHSLDIISWCSPYIKYPGGLQDTPATNLILEELTVIMDLWLDQNLQSTNSCKAR